MAVEKKALRDQVCLFAVTLEDMVPKGHLSRLVDQFVSGVGLDALGLRRRRRGECGAPSYAPDLLLSVWIYGYFKKIRSSRMLERACRDDIGLIWLTGGQAPDHNTLWRFWRDNAKAVGLLFKATALTAVESGMAGVELVALDGTKVLSAGGMRQGYVDKSLAKYAARLEREVAEIEREVGAAGADLPEDAALCNTKALLADKQLVQAKVSAARKTLEMARQKALIPHEPEARSMLTGGGSRMCYNAQAVADSGSGVVLAAALTNEANDAHQLTTMIAAVGQTVGKTPALTLADSGYNTLDEFGKAQEAGYDVLVNSCNHGEDRDLDRPENGRPEVHEFIYNKDADTVTCPRQGIELTRIGKPRRRKDANKTEFQLFICKNLECPLRQACSKDKRGRTVEISPQHHLREKNRVRGKTEEGKRLLKRRKAVIEPVFGQIKHNEGFRKFSFMGLQKAEAQWLFICAVHNLRKIFKHLSQGLSKIHA